MSVRFFIFCLKSVLEFLMIIPITAATNQVLKTAQGDKYAMLYAHKIIHEPGIKKTATRLPFMSSSSSLKAMSSTLFWTFSERNR